MYTSEANDLATYLPVFQSTLASLLDKHAPEKTITCKSSPDKPFITAEIRSQKAKRSRLEAIYRKTKTEENLEKFKQQSRLVAKLITNAKREHYRTLVAKQSAQPRKLWNTLNLLLGCSKRSSLPATTSPSSLASAFLTFFGDKIAKLQSTSQPLTRSPHDAPPAAPPLLTQFSMATTEEVKTAIMASSDATCSLDFIPTSLLKSCLDSLLQPITKLINICLLESTFPSCFKTAIIKPLIKKHSLPKDDLSSYRPISNLNFISKLLERIIYNRLQAHLSSFPSIAAFQSAYRKYHSVETALLRIQNDLLLGIENRHVTALVLLDLSAAFDTIDHNILLTRLASVFGICGSAIDTLASYISNRSQFVKIDSHSSDAATLSSGVPQGSVLGPLLFSLYTTPICHLLENSGVSFHLYADDTQLYIAFFPQDHSSALLHLSSILDSVHAWLTSNRLVVNASKTEYLLVGTKNQRAKLLSTSLTFKGSDLSPSQTVRNLGVHFDSDMTLTKHISSVCSSSYYIIRQIRQIRSSLDRKSSILVANALVSSKLDFCNSLYYGLPHSSIHRLQLVQNSLARVICPSVKRRDHITPTLRSLHWLPISSRITYKIAIITHKTLHTNSPSYLRSLLSPYAPPRCLRSSEKCLLTVPPLRSTAGRRSFQFAAPSVWNSLPLTLRTKTNLQAFRASLKAHLFPP